MVNVLTGNLHAFEYMSINFEEKRHSIGLRLATERKRVGLSQSELGAVGGVKQLAQSNYEQGKRAPDSDYWSAITLTGIDVQYVLTGLRSTNAAEIAENQATYSAMGSEPDPLLQRKRKLKELLDQVEDGELLDDIQAMVTALQQQRARRG